MSSASALRLQIESTLARRIPSALTPAPRIIRPVIATGIATLDEILHGGLPIGAVTEVVGPECSGRTSLALSFIARITQAARVCAWIDVSNALDPAAAAAAGVDLARLLWVRCGALPQPTHPATPNFSLPQKYLAPPTPKKGLHGGGFGPHPRTESNGLSQAVPSLLRPEAIAPRCAEPQPRIRAQHPPITPVPTHPVPLALPPRSTSSWAKMDEALRATDLILQSGGFSAIVLDMAGLPPEFVSRVPLATWFRYRAAAERTQSSILLLSQHPCAKSSAELILRLLPGTPHATDPTVFTGLEHTIEIARHRFTQSNVVPIRKPPQSAQAATWHTRTAWACHP